MKMNSEISYPELFQNFLYDQLCILVILLMIYAINTLQSLHNWLYTNRSIGVLPNTSAPDPIATDSRYIEMFSELCADDIDFPTLRDKISKIVEEICQLLCCYQKIRRPFKLNCSELHSKF